MLSQEIKLPQEQIEQLNKGVSLPIMEHFYTVQGEGANSGQPAYFIRVGGCDVGCHWCDVKESWNANTHPLIPVNDLKPFLLDIPAKDVVVTGGEPTHYNLKYLCDFLHELGFRTFIETSGADELTGNWNWICLSPKKNSPPVANIYPLADELKVIVYNLNDLKWAEEHAAKVSKDCKLYLQPEWSKHEQIMPLLVDYVMKHPMWNISLQTHKYMHIP